MLTAEQYAAEAKRRGILPALCPPDCDYAGGDCIEQNPNELGAFMAWVQQFEIKSYLEIGVSSGGLACYVADMLKPERIYGADLRFPRLFASGMDFFQGSSQFNPWFDIWLEHVGTVDLVMIDADHSYDAVKADAASAAKLKPKIMAFHDICGLRECDGVKRFWDTVIRDTKAGLVEFFIDADNPCRSGIGAIRM